MTRAARFRKAKVGHMHDGERERFAYCRACRSRYSADRADYFMAKDSTVLRCCDEDCVIATESCRINAA